MSEVPLHYRGGHTSGKLVAAMTTIPSEETNPSMSARSWFSVMRMYLSGYVSGYEPTRKRRVTVD